MVFSRSVEGLSTVRGVRSRHDAFSWKLPFKDLVSTLADRFSPFAISLLLHLSQQRKTAEKGLYAAAMEGG